MKWEQVSLVHCCAFAGRWNAEPLSNPSSRWWSFGILFLGSGDRAAPKRSGAEVSDGGWIDCNAGTNGVCRYKRSVLSVISAHWGTCWGQISATIRRYLNEHSMLGTRSCRQYSAVSKDLNFLLSSTLIEWFLFWPLAGHFFLRLTSALSFRSAQELDTKDGPLILGGLVFLTAL